MLDLVLEVLDLQREDFKEKLLTASGDEIYRLQGAAKAASDLKKLLMRKPLKES